MFNLFYQDLRNYSDKDILTLSKMYGFDAPIVDLRWMIAIRHAQQEATMLSGGIITFVKRLPDLQDAASRDNDNSFIYISQDYINDLLKLINDQQDFKKQLRKLPQEEKRKNEAILNKREKMLKNSPEWQKIESLRNRFDVPQEYFNWTIDAYIKGGIDRLQDISTRLKPALENLKWLKKTKKISKKFSSLKELENFLEQTEIAEMLNEKNEELRRLQEAQEGGEIIYDGKDIKIIKAINREGACYYGQGTKWCTAAKKDNLFNLYNRDGPLFIIQPKNLGNNKKEKYQIHFESASFMDEKDNRVNFFELVKKYPELEKLQYISPQEYPRAYIGALFQIIQDDLENLFSYLSEFRKFIDSLTDKELLFITQYNLIEYEKNKQNKENLDVAMNEVSKRGLINEINGTYHVLFENINALKYLDEYGYKFTIEQLLEELDLPMSRPQIIEILANNVQVSPNELTVSQIDKIIDYIKDPKVKHKLLLAKAIYTKDYAIAADIIEELSGNVLSEQDRRNPDFLRKIVAYIFAN